MMCTNHYEAVVSSANRRRSPLFLGLVCQVFIPGLCVDVSKWAGWDAQHRNIFMHVSFDARMFVSQ